MLILTETTDKIQVVLGTSVTTNQLQCKTSWRDITTTAYTPGRTLINTNNTTDVDIVGAPAASTQRVIDHINIYNRDTVGQTVTVKFDANATEYILWKGSLSSGETLTYADGVGWVISESGNLSGTYTPTLSNTTNVSSSTAYACQYARTGNTVTVSGKVDVTPTAGAPTQTVLGISLPIASDFGSAEQCCGTANCDANYDTNGRITADGANNRATLTFYAATTGTQGFSFIFAYQVI